MATTTLPAAVRQRRATGPNRLTLPVVLTGTFVATLDFFIVNVAVPDLQRDLHTTAGGIEFVVAGFGLAYGTGIVTGGRLGDLYGRRRMFAVGLALFTVASLACGVAPTIGVLVAARVAQGLAAAVLAPQVLAIVSGSYAGAARARALAAYALAMGFAAVFGQLIGGGLIRLDVAGTGWRACFLVNVPIGLGALALVRRAVPAVATPARSRLDVRGTLVVTAGLVALVLPLVEGRERGWPAWTWGCLAAALPLLAGFAAFERRVRAAGGDPLVDPTLFRERAFTVGLAAQLVFWLGQASFFLVLALYLQQGRHLTPLAAGVAFLPMGAGYLAASLAATGLARRLGRQVLALGGLTRVVGQLGLILTVAVHGSVAWLAPSLAVDGAGMGFALAPLAATVLARVSPRHLGAASGVLSAASQIGNAIGVAVIGVVFYGALGSGDGSGRAFQLGCLFVVGVGLALALLVQALPAPAAATPSPVPTPRAAEPAP